MVTIILVTHLVTIILVTHVVKNISVTHTVTSFSVTRVVTIILVSHVAGNNLSGVAEQFATQLGANDTQYMICLCSIFWHGE